MGVAGHEIEGRNRDGEAGFSLIEIIVALGLFSLISLAGFVLVSSILQVRGRTEGRLEELGNAQRAMLLLTSDFQQGVSASLRVGPQGAAVERSVDGSAVAVRYAIDDGKLTRQVSVNGGAGPQQTVLTEIATLRWRVYERDSGWLETWPPISTAADSASSKPEPLAIAIEMDLAGARVGVSGTLRRTIELTAPP